MARYTGPKCKHCRRLGVSVCGTANCAYDKRPYPPGEQGRGRIKESEYLLQLREKQKARRLYGVLERQFRRYYEEAHRRSGLTGHNLLELLEARLDNVVYRAGLARTRPEARQLVSHRHVLVNNRTVNVPSYRVRPGDVIEIRPRARDSQALIGSLEVFGSRNVPGWLTTDPEQFKITVQDVPARTQIDVPVQEQMIVELYSK